MIFILVTDIYRTVDENCIFVAIREGIEDVSTWNWLGANESMDIPTPTEQS